MNDYLIEKHMGNKSNSKNRNPFNSNAWCNKCTQHIITKYVYYVVALITIYDLRFFQWKKD